MANTQLSIAKDFSDVPGGRLRRNGPFSAEEFRDVVLIPALRRAIEGNQVLEVIFDGTAGYGSSFLEESFGGLVRAGTFPKEIVSKHLRLKADDPLYAGYRALAERYLKDALAKTAT
jgi:hypothetical protein